MLCLSPNLIMGLFHSKYRTLHFALPAKHQFTAHFSSLSHWMAPTRNWSKADRLVVPRSSFYPEERSDICLRPVLRNVSQSSWSLKDHWESSSLHWKRPLRVTWFNSSLWWTGIFSNRSWLLRVPSNLTWNVSRNRASITSLGNLARVSLLLL